MSLRPLRSALETWRPSGAAQADPLTLIAGAWPRIVGPAIAKRTRPAQITGDTLVVVTRSSAWSQQLSLLASDVLAGLHRVAGVTAVTRLRFRVGRTSPERRGGAPAVRAHFSHGALASALSPEASMRELIEHLRTAVARRRSAAAACPICGAPRDEPTPCAPCAEEARAQRRMAAERLMYDAPWLGFSGVAAIVGGLDRTEYDAWRKTLLSRWWEMLVRAKWTKRVGPLERRVASSYALLHSGLQPERITPAVVRNLLGDELAALLDTSASSAAAVKKSPKRPASNTPYR